MEKRIIKVFEKMKVLFKDMNRIDLVEFVDYELELLNRKANSSKMTKTQVENEDIKKKIVKALTEIDKPVTISELQGLNEEMAQFKNQKLSALLKQLIESNEVVRTEIKKKAFFTIVK